MAHALLCITSSDRLAHWRSVLPPGMSVVVASSLSAASVQVAGGERFVAAVVDVGEVALRRELGLLRASAPLLPVLAVVETPCAEALNAAQGQRAEVVCGLPAPAQLEAFLGRVLRAGRLGARDMSDWIQHLFDTRKLRSSDAELLAVVFGEETREQASARLGFTDKQMTRRMRALCRRCDARTPLGAARNLMRDALVLGRPQRAAGVDAPEPVAIPRVA